jgi:hypothetical protein
MSTELNKSSKENNMQGLRHGENLLLPVAKISGKKSSHKIFIVGHSETGHHHVLEATKPFDVLVDNDQIFIELFSEANLVHKKSFDQHNTLVVKPGKYQVKRKTEYDPWQGVIREVFD